MDLAQFHLQSIQLAPLSVRLSHPFVIASARVDVTPNVLVRVEVREIASGKLAFGLGEAATLWPVTAEQPSDILKSLGKIAEMLPLAIDDARLNQLPPCASAGLDMAILDALGKLSQRPVFQLLQPDAQPVQLTTDITIAIGQPQQMARLAAGWSERGFRCFKVKVGLDLSIDLQALVAIVAAVPDCVLRLDANGGYTQAQAVNLCKQIDRLQLPVQCFEQPCATEDLAAMAAVTNASPFDVIADESCKTMQDLDGLLDTDSCNGINLKLVKTGGLRQCYAIGMRARANGLSLMVGAMVETRLGITAAAHLATALGGVQYPDLDTAFLLDDDPFVGGYHADRANLHLTGAAGLGVEVGKVLGI